MELAPKAPPEQFNFAAHLLALNQARGEKVAYIDDLGTLTYAELEHRIRSFASSLLRLGLRREERILVAMLDTVDLPVVFLGALYAGVVPVLVNTLLTADDYAYMIGHSRAQLVVTSGPLLDKLRAAVTTSGTSLRLLVSQPAARDAAADGAPGVPGAPGAPGAHGAPGDLDLDALLAEPPAAAPADTHVDDIAFWLYSSGSTGRPKGTVHTHGNLHWTAELYAKPILGIRESDVVFSAAKLFFAYGLGNALTFPLSVGATTVLMAERATCDAIFARLTRHKPTLFCGVPTLFLAMLASPALPARADVALRVCTSAGEALPQQVGERFTAHFGAEILDGIGSTEMLHIFLSNRPGEVVYGTTGVPVPGYDVALRDETGALVPDGEIGDLYVKGPSTALLYWRNRDKTRATFLGDWMKTGDKYQRLPTGHYVYAGRSDDMLKVSGQYVAPVEVEIVLQEHECVLEAAVIGKVDPSGLMRTCAFVVLREGHAPGDHLVLALQAFVKGRLAPHKYPREIAFVTELPKTATGKIQRFRLREGG
ncbi:benzoate-CoA ligase family protein [Chondromyces apiculatus]|uniref:Benzoate-CoA ligase n=1 Tax=Chondromyces apiculatus DSM 436 TaxID=1192034 RepID=A0A017SXU7_9BACT|nr:benzoate-CoA ligase family protein [Chondromyces apiculatus]EYF01798.1 Benzoate-CoA ligase [Chondromyces apiculatus DSM 436]